MVKAQSEMGNAVKDSKNPFFKSSYADLNSIREASLPVLNKHGISVLQPTSVIDGRLYVETLLLHESGEYLSGLYEVVVGKQNDPQALGSAISYSRRYSLQSMINIGAEDNDAESATDRNKTSVRSSAEQKPALPAPKLEVKTETVTRQADAATIKVETAPAASRGSFRRNSAQPSGGL